MAGPPSSNPRTESLQYDNPGRIVLTLVLFDVSKGRGP